MKDYFKYYGEALTKVAIGGFLIGMGTYFATDGIYIYGAQKFVTNAYGLDKDATIVFMNVMKEKIGK